MHPPEDSLVLAWLRPGSDTLACRLVKEGVASLEDLGSRLGLLSGDLTGRVATARALAAAARQEAVDRGYGLVTWGDETYPSRLAEIVDPPLALWTRGDASFEGPAIAIVGSRLATPAGVIVARQLSRDLVAAGYTIVSGMAAGVDGAAHEAALAEGGTTIAVLGCGVDIAYPSHHRRLAEAIIAAGRLVSEFPPGTSPKPWHFPLRNRIISGLSQAVIVIEASEKSGSLITARLAMEQGRDVLAVPGSVASGRYRGCHALIKDGARLVETVDDVLEEVEGISAGLAGRGDDKAWVVSKLEAGMARGEAYSVDELAGRTGLAVPDLLAELAQLEIAGRISRSSGGRFVRP